MMTVMGTLKDRAGTFIASAGDINRLTIDKMEEAVKLNLASASYYSEVGVRQLRAMSGVRDMDSMRKFTADTISLSGEIAKKMLDDSKAWMNLGNDIKEKFTDIFAKREEDLNEAKKKAGSSVKSVVAS
jgi:phasin family protein